MAEYIKQEMCDLNGTGGKAGVLSDEDTTEHGHGGFRGTDHLPGSGLSRGSVIQVMTTVAEHLPIAWRKAVGHVGWHRYVHAPPRRSEGQGDRLAGW